MGTDQASTAGREHRIDVVVAPGRFALDDARGMDALIALGMRDGRHHATRVADRFLSSPAAPFIPCKAVRPEERNPTP